jgi:ABC-2 type transport system permease protein
VTGASTFRFPRRAVVGAIARRDFQVTRSYRLAFGLDVLYGLLQLSTYFFISKVVGGTAVHSLGSAPSYFAFAAVGAVMAVVLSATVYALSGELRNEQLTGTFEALAAQPLTSLELCTGFVSFPLIFASLRAAAYLVVASVWMHLDVSKASLPGVAAMLAATAFAMAPIGILAGAAVLVLKRGTIIVSALITLMSMLAGAVFPVSVLPVSLQWLGRAMPVRFAYDGVRAAMFTGKGWNADLLALVGYGALLTPVALLAFARALARARHTGTLSEY